VQMRTECEAYTAGVEPPPYGCRCVQGARRTGADADRVRGVHGGSRTPALRVQMRTRCDAYGCRCGQSAKRTRRE
ncbi:MAG: hypothetical protein J6L90_05925, partial [Clostridia bacterium]|nr:hypothetical protein [Clostridia bacterium]